MVPKIINIHRNMQGRHSPTKTLNHNKLHVIYYVNSYISWRGRAVIEKLEKHYAAMFYYGLDLEVIHSSFFLYGRTKPSA